MLTKATTLALTAVTAAATVTLLACGGQGTKTDNSTTPPPDAAAVAADDGAFGVSVTWVTGPQQTSAGSNTCRLHFTDGQHRAVSKVEAVGLRPHMPTMAHDGVVTDLTLVPDPAHPDTIVASGFRFQMGGSWDLIISATVSGVAGTAHVPVQIPR